ncbi:polyhydroxybutyrate depolymerase [Pseudorhizobium endolithicum]|uniref:Polyhydroxybutyrate depolymerase n=2 Tax=Pseudorhizobium endolithicum TaxID=1191678 RepID=A0ABN7JVS3_9HYPH|nr:polyhydroxybutyrate depolymerase [Pseudorhizobium endolithicum]
MGANAALAGGCGQPIQPGRHEFSIQSADAVRSGVYFIPSSYAGTEKVPVVFDFHGSHSNPLGQLRRSSWDQVAEKEGFIVVALQGSLPGAFDGTHAWNVPLVTTQEGGLDEIAFIGAAVRTIEETACIDRSRIYASGYSGGGRMLSQYICSGRDDFAAAGFVHSLRAGAPVEVDGQWKPDAATCAPARPMSIIAFAGEKDDANPYAGGGKPYWQYGFSTALQRWSELNGCTGDAVTRTAGDVTQRLYDTCKAGARIAAYSYANGTHAWPKIAPAEGVMAAASSSASQAGIVEVSSAARAPAFDPSVDPAPRMWEFFLKADKANVVAEASPAVIKTGTAVASGCDVSAGAQGTTCSSQPNDLRRSGQGVRDAL